MFKNSPGQKLTLLAIDTAANAPKTGDAANLTAYLKKDNGAFAALADTLATEEDAANAPGLYTFDLAQAETDGDRLVFSGKSATSGVRLVPLIVYTRPAAFNQTTLARLDVASSTLALATALTTVGAEVTAIKSKTDQLAFTVANQVNANTLSIAGIVCDPPEEDAPPTADAIADAVWDEPRAGHTATGSYGVGLKLAYDGLDAITVEAGVNARQALSPILAAAGGVMLGVGTGTVLAKAGANPTTTRITATIDSAKNRTAVALNLPT